MKRSSMCPAPWAGAGPIGEEGGASPSAVPGPSSGVSSGKVHVGQQEELSSGPHQRTGRDGLTVILKGTEARPSPHLGPGPGSQVVDYYKEACRALENPDTASLLGRIQKDWKKLVQMKIYYFAAVAHVRAPWPLGQSWAGLSCHSSGSK